MKVGFVGAGNIGQGVARLALGAGYEAAMANSRGPETLREVAAEIGVQATTLDGAIKGSDLVVFSVPFNRVWDIDPAPFAGHVVLDTTNYYPTRDGQYAELDEHRATTSELVQRHLVGATVVKAFNAIMAADLVAPFGLPERRRALPVATGDEGALAAVVDFHNRIGFDVVPAGPLSEGWRFERAKPAYCIPLDRRGLVDALAAAERDVEMPHNSWKRDS